MGADQQQGIPLQPLKTRLSGCLCIALAGLLAPAALSQLPAARLSSIFPPGGQAGTEVEIHVKGQDLDESDELLFSHPGLTARPADTNLAAASGPLRFQIRIASNTPPGLHDVRVRSRFGVSNVRPFEVSGLPELRPPSTHTNAALPLSVPLPSVVNGELPPVAPLFFRIQANPGVVVVDCRANRIDSKLQPVLTLYDPTGRQVARSAHGERLAFTVPAAGDYTLKLHDIAYRGGDGYPFRLHLDTGPVIADVFPPAIPRSGTTRVTLLGWNLPGGTNIPLALPGQAPYQQLEISVDPAAIAKRSAAPTFRVFKPATAFLETGTYLWNVPGHPSQYIPFALLDEPIRTEREPNDTTEDAEPLQAPIAFAGRFLPVHDLDRFTFEARKDEIYWIEILSHRLGNPTDPRIVIDRLDPAGNGPLATRDARELPELDANLGGADFNTSSRDAGGRFEVKQDGRYRVTLRDVFNRPPPNPGRTYVLRLGREQPDFQLAVLPNAFPPATADGKGTFPWSTALRPGETIPLRVLALRRGGFKDPIEVHAEDLPSGVRADPLTLQPDQSAGTLLLTAETNATSAWSKLRVVGRATQGNAQLERTAGTSDWRWSVADLNQESLEHRASAGLVVSVHQAEPALCTIRAAEPGPVWDVAPKGKVTLKLLVRAADGLKEKFKVKPTGDAALKDLPEIEIDPTQHTALTTIDAAKLKPGTYRFWLQGTAKAPYRNNPQAATNAEVRLAKLAEAAATARMSADSAAKELAEAVKALKSASTELSQISAADQAAAQDRLGALETARKDAETRGAEAARAAEAAETLRRTAEEESKRATEQAKPREVTFPVYSPLFTLNVRTPPPAGDTK